VKKSITIKRFTAGTLLKITSIMVLSGLLLCGCRSLPGNSSTQEQFCREHPDATILSTTRNDAFYPNDAARSFMDIGFVYRDADGTEHEEVLHYKRSAHGWYLEKKEQIR
jgi:hypothetical protein